VRNQARSARFDWVCESAGSDWKKEIPAIPLRTIDKDDCRNALVTFITLALEKEERALENQVTGRKTGS